MTPQEALITFSPWEPGLFSLTLYAIMVIGLIGVILFLTGWLGERKSTPEQTTPYECGIHPTGSARFRYPIPFYLVAAFFLIFDLETVFIFAWAIAFRDLGWIGWLQITFFIFVLLLSLLYIWKKGGFDWKIARGSPSKLTRL